MERILAPHGDQTGWVYVRLPKSFVTPIGSSPPLVPGLLRAVVSSRAPARVELTYPDVIPPARIISSRRVEEAVETADYLKRCADEGLVAHQGALVGDRRWVVWSSVDDLSVFQDGHTLREAYYRFRAKAEGEAS